MIGLTVDQLFIGQTVEFSKTISESDVYLYSGITGDFNPAHINEPYAQTTFFKTRIVHGMLIAGLISAILGSRLPGPGTIYVHQELSFLAPVYFGDTVTARVEVTEIDIEKNRAKVRTTCLNQDGKKVIDGTRACKPP